MGNVREREKQKSNSTSPFLHVLLSEGGAEKEAGKAGRLCDGRARLELLLTVYSIMLPHRTANSAAAAQHGMA